jgi:DNA-binding beta-propeller fold protein YncE
MRPTVLTLLPLIAMLGTTPGSQQSHPGGGTIAVSLSGENSVVFVAPATGTIVGRSPAGDVPHELIASADGTRVYVANAGDSTRGTPGRTISAIDARSRSLLAEHDLKDHRSPHDVRVSRDGSLLWVAVAPSRAVLEIDARTGALVRTWPTDADGGWFVAVTPDDRKIYVPHLEGRRVTAIDRKTGRRTTVYASGAQSGIDISPDGERVWVIDHERQRINVISAAAETVAARVPLPSTTFGRLRFSPDGRRIVVVQGRRLSTIDAASLKETGAVEMPLAAKVVAVSPDGRRAAVSNPADDSITIVDLAAMRVIGSHRVGRTPDGIVWFDGPAATRSRQPDESARSRARPETLARSMEPRFPRHRLSNPCDSRWTPLLENSSNW